MSTDRSNWRPYLFANGRQKLAIIAPGPRAAQEYFKRLRCQGTYLGEDRRTPQQRRDSKTMATMYQEKPL